MKRETGNMKRETRIMYRETSCFLRLTINVSRKKARSESCQTEPGNFNAPLEIIFCPSPSQMILSSLTQLEELELSVRASVQNSHFSWMIPTYKPQRAVLKLSEFREFYVQSRNLRREGVPQRKPVRSTSENQMSNNVLYF